MPITPYDACPCGTGKKLKWCCAPYWPKVEQAVDVQQKGQHETSIRLLKELCEEYPSAAPPQLYLAQIALGQEDLDLAEAALVTAEKLDPTLGLIYLLRSNIAEMNQDILGAITQLQNGLRLVSPEAKELSLSLAEALAALELRRNGILPARAVLELAMKTAPNEVPLREEFDRVFGPVGSYPEVARKAYRFRPTAKPITVASAKLPEARTGYRALTEQVPNDPAAWFNLGLCEAWLSEPQAALAAMSQSLELEFDDDKAEETAALVELLRCGFATDESDYANYLGYSEIREPKAVMQWLRTTEAQGRFLAPQMDEETGRLTVVLAEQLPNLIDTGSVMLKPQATLTVANGIITLLGSSEAAVAKLTAEMRDQLQLAITEPTIRKALPNLSELMLAAWVYPAGFANPEEADRKVSAHCTNYFENIWAHAPQKALSGNSPTDAAGSKLLRKRLLGVLKFTEDCFNAMAPRTEAGTSRAKTYYDFVRLRHKLNVEKAAAGAPPAELIAAAKVDFAAMNVAELGKLNAEQLDAATLEEAMKAALKLDARELAVHFARTAAGKPADAAKPDRYAVYLALMSAAMSEKNTNAALDALQQGQAYDAAHNGAKRANDYGLREAQLKLKGGMLDGAVEGYKKLIEANPGDAKYTITAIEAMLGAKQQQHAQAFVDRGLELSKETGNRDLEGACRELADAVKRMQ